MTAPDCRLYLVTPPALPDLPAFVAALERAFSGGEVAALQVRLKDAPDGVVAEAVHAVTGPARAAGCAVILNDRPDLAAALGCDGVHLGQDDAPYAEARRLLGPGRIVGVTCHDSLHLAFEAAEAGADYVAFGSVFPTTTKAAKARAPLDLLTGWQSHMETPCVAIGGITPANAREVARAGADFLAVSAGAWSYPEGPAAAVAALTREAAAGVAERSR
ncbi:MAG: thiamine phosphate synthase [Caulobacteraceae bacterium]|nr:thiamine phosphate synthase [Caulobacter sp.]